MIGPFSIIQIEIGWLPTKPLDMAWKAKPAENFEKSEKNFLVGTKGLRSRKSGRFRIGAFKKMKS